MAKPENKRVAVEFFRLIEQGRFEDILQFFAPDCRTHNPNVGGGMTELIDAMIAANAQMRSESPLAEISIASILSDGDMVAVHTELLNSRGRPDQGGLRQAHIFRFQGDKVVEYWDITQVVTPNLPNAAGAF